MRRLFLSIIAILIVPAAEASAQAKTRSALDRDLDGYAVSTCLMETDNAALKDQGARWAGAIVQRSHGPIEAFSRVADAVRVEIKENGFAQGHDDGPVATGAISMPMLTCGEVTDQPKVAHAMSKAKAALRKHYSARQ
jgi:hypothetical protein